MTTLVVIILIALFIAGADRWVDYSCLKELRKLEAAADAQAKQRVEERELKIAMEEVEKFLENEGEEDNFKCRVG